MLRQSRAKKILLRSMVSFVGQIQQFGTSKPLKGWLFCHGQELLIKDHAKLFSLMGTYFGGDGVRAFRLPNLRVKNPINGVYHGHGETMTNGLPFFESQINVGGIYPLLD